MRIESMEDRHARLSRISDRVHDYLAANEPRSKCAARACHHLAVVP